VGAKCIQRFLEKIGEYKWDLEMTAADTAEGAVAADAAAALVAVATADLAK